MKNKDELRIFAKNLRKSLNTESISKKICENIHSHKPYNEANNILAFYPMKQEVDLRFLFKDSSKNWFLPRIENYSKNLLVHSYSSEDILIKSKWGVLEPKESSQIIDEKEIDVALIPALMADKKGYRLGYGAGFYDRFIPKLRNNCLKLIPIPEELLVKSLVYDSWDIPANGIVTQNDIIILN